MSLRKSGVLEDSCVLLSHTHTHTHTIMTQQKPHYLWFGPCESSSTDVQVILFVL